MRTVTANLVVFGLFFCGTRLWPDHPFQFVALLVTAIGLATVLFHRVVREAGCGARRRRAAAAGGRDGGGGAGGGRRRAGRPAFWFSQPEYHWCCAVYMFTRLLSNLSLTYLAFFVRDALAMPSSALSTVPATLYLASLGPPSCSPPRAPPRAPRLSLGAAACAAACAGCMALPAAPDALVWAVYPLVVVLGWGSTTCMVTSVSSQADLIGARVVGRLRVRVDVAARQALNGVAILRSRRIARPSPRTRSATTRLVLVVGCGGRRCPAPRAAGRSSTTGGSRTRARGGRRTGEFHRPPYLFSGVTTLLSTLQNSSSEIMPSASRSAFSIISEISSSVMSSPSSRETAFSSRR